MMNKPRGSPEASGTFTNSSEMDAIDLNCEDISFALTLKICN